MKRITVLLACLFVTATTQAQINDTTTLRNYINANIIPNSTRSITATQLNNILNGFLNVLSVSPNMYNSNGSITEDRFVSGGKQYGLSIDSLTFFAASARSMTEDTVSTFQILPGAVTFGTGIGSLDKRSAFDVKVYPNQYIALYNGSSSSEGLFIDATNNIGIGTNEPATKLDVNGALSVRGYLDIGNNAASITGLGNASFPSVTVSGATTLNGTTTITGELTTNNIAITGAIRLPFVSITQDYTVADDDYTIINKNASASNINITLPDPAASSGRIINFIENSSNSANWMVFNIGIMYNDGATITRLSNAQPLTASRRITIQSDGINWYIINY